MPAKERHMEAFGAKELKERFGELLVGREVETERIGAWAGGLCRVTAVDPDPEAPDVALEVERLSDGAGMSVFADEVVKFALPDPKAVVEKWSRLAAFAAFVEQTRARLPADEREGFDQLVKDTHTLAAA